MMPAAKGLLATIFAAFTMLITAHAQQPSAARVVIHPEDNGATLNNPGMGWMLYHYDNDIRKYESKLDPADVVAEFNGVTVVYLRLAWGYLEPLEGHYNWALVDGPMQKWIQAGKQIALRFTTSEGAPNGRSIGGYATPQWVEKAGAKGCHLTVAQTNVGKSATLEQAPNGEVFEPDFNDPLFLAKLDKFLAAAADRYDGNPHVAFVDVAFGVWGEGHTYCADFDAATVERTIDLYRKNFKKTLLVVNSNVPNQKRGMAILTYAAQHGMALRDDSIMVKEGIQTNFNAWKLGDPQASFAKQFWPKTPVILETEHYGLGKVRNNWHDGSAYLKSLEDFHASYASIHGDARDFLNDNRDLIHRMDMRMGYRLQLRSVSLPARVKSEERFSVRYEFANAGVAPCLPGGYPAVTLEDNKGGIAAVFVDSGFNVRDLPVADAGKAKVIAQDLSGLTVPPHYILQPGSYKVYLSVGDSTGLPTIELPLSRGDGHKRYQVGQIDVASNRSQE